MLNHNTCFCIRDKNTSLFFLEPNSRLHCPSCPPVHTTQQHVCCRFFDAHSYSRTVIGKMISFSRKSRKQTEAPSLNACLCMNRLRFNYIFIYNKISFLVLDLKVCCSSKWWTQHLHLSIMSEGHVIIVLPNYSTTWALCSISYTSVGDTSCSTVQPVKPSLQFTMVFVRARS